MVTRVQAQQIRQQYIASLPDRLDAAIMSAAAAGQTSVTITYAPSTDAAAAALVTALIAAGWASASANTTDKTITVAP